MKNFQLKSRYRNTIAAWIFILPALIGTFIFIIIPVIFSFALSFVKWDLLNEIQYAGLENFKYILGDKLFLKVLLNTFVYAISVSVLGVIIPLVLAAILNNKIRGGELYKTAYFIPFITPMIVIALVWQWIFDPNAGCLNQFLHLHINWLYDKAYAMPALILVSVWKLTGYNMIIFLSGFAGINQDLLEASKIDGANVFDTFRHVTIPLLSSTIFFVIVITSISSFQVFDLIYMMTEGGPENSTMVLVYSIYKYAFEYFDAGKASAIAYILFAIIFVLVLFQWKLRKKLVYNEQ
ncbi:MAG: sugar ABC transporter permease [Candidatus Gastranaerophilales bacterium]|nr:sugar ABC transporter permease [Candidatus Gastranaerophilales bacterium]